MERFFEVEALVGLDEKNNPVSNYMDAKYFNVTNADDKNILCWGIYERLPGTGEANHIADFPTMDNAMSMLKFLEENIVNS